MTKLFENIWDFLASVKLSVVTLLSLAATSVIGTLIPQNEPLDAYVAAFGPFLARLFQVLGFYDLYHAGWFQALIFLLAINLTVCSIERLSSTWKIIFPSKKSPQPARFRKLSGRHQLSANGSLEDLRQKLSEQIGRKFGKQQTANTDGGGFCIYAEKWRWTRLGAYVVHISILLLLVGSMMGSLYGFEGFISIPEGESRDQIRLRGSNALHTLDFAIRCDDFNVSFYPDGRPNEFRSELSILENGEPIHRQSIIVNAPLRFRGINVFQSSYGEIGPSMDPQTAKAPESVTLQVVKSGDPQTSHQYVAAVGDEIVLKEEMGKLTIMAYLPNADFRGQPIGPALATLLTPKEGQPQQVLLPLRFPSFDKMRKGRLFISVIDQKREKFTPGQDPAAKSNKRYATGLQVTKDPGVPVVYTGFILMIAGCFITFFMSHRQLMVEIVPKGGRHEIHLAGTANKNKPGMQRQVDALKDQIANIVASGNR